MLRVIVADDQDPVRERLCESLEEASGIRVVAQACDADHALSLADAHPAEVLVCDTNMPGPTGVELVSLMSASHPDVRVLFLTVGDDAPYALALLRAGADGCLPKHVSAAQLVEAVRRVAGGERVVVPNLAARVLQVGRSSPPVTIRPLSHTGLSAPDSV